MTSFVSEATKPFVRKKRAVQRPEGQPDEGCIAALEVSIKENRLSDERPSQVCSKKAGCPTGQSPSGNHLVTIKAPPRIRVAAGAFGFDLEPDR
jgi:hypothetical protein